MHSSRMPTVRCSSHLGACLPGGVCLEGVYLGGVCLGVSAVVSAQGGVCHTAPPPPVNRITDACENITADGKKYYLLVIVKKSMELQLAHEHTIRTILPSSVKLVILYLLYFHVYCFLYFS